MRAEPGAATAAAAAAAAAWGGLGGRAAVGTASASAASAASAAPAAPADGAPAEVVLYDTLRRAKAPVVPHSGGSSLTMYVCGVTVYDLSHIGHARAYVAYDLLFRALRRAGFDVTYCRNFTDVDDKIIARARESGEGERELAERMAVEFHRDMDALGILRPTLEPRATDHIPDIIKQIEAIISNGHAYAVDGGDVYFSVPSMQGRYGRLSGRGEGDNRAGERVGVDQRKHDPADFALWKGVKADEPSWDSPWGKGRPGWHIECSAMIEAMLGGRVDIHGGGRDLVFPHHENELAQAEAACSCGGHCGAEAAEKEDFVFAGHWVHNGFVNVDSEKMSKSLGNFFTIRDVLKSYSPVALRFFLMGTQYRAPVNFSQRGLEEASERMFYIMQTVLEARAVLTELAAEPAVAEEGSSGAAGASEAVKAAESLVSDSDAALRDDINTPAVIAGLSAPLKALNDLTAPKGKKKKKLNATPGQRTSDMAALLEALETVLEMLGLPAAESAMEAALMELRHRALVRAELTEEELAGEVAAREQAREAKDYARADEIRKDLETRGVALLDGGAAGGTQWQPCARMPVTAST